MRNLLFITVLLVPLWACAQADPVNSTHLRKDGSGQSIGSLRPYLLAVSVENLDRSVEWYADVLGFTESQRYEFPDDRMRLAFMEREGFELELVEIANTPPFSAPDPGNPATRRGLVKFAFHSEDIGGLYASAVEAGSRVQSSLRKSNRTGGQFFILLDPDGNWVQVFGPGN